MFITTLLVHLFTLQTQRDGRGMAMNVEKRQFQIVLTDDWRPNDRGGLPRYEEYQPPDCEWNTLRCGLWFKPEDFENPKKELVSTCSYKCRTNYTLDGHKVKHPYKPALFKDIIWRHQRVLCGDYPEYRKLTLQEIRNISLPLIEAVKVNLSDAREYAASRFERYMLVGCHKVRAGDEMHILPLLSHLEYQKPLTVLQLYYGYIYWYTIQMYYVANQHKYNRHKTIEFNKSPWRVCYNMEPRFLIDFQNHSLLLAEKMNDVLCALRPLIFTMAAGDSVYPKPFFEMLRKNTWNQILDDFRQNCYDSKRRDCSEFFYSRLLLTRLETFMKERSMFDYETCEL